ncbi:MAG: hypothetical protein ACPG32_04475 [Akkermansiaceae bacterium]
MAKSFLITVELLGGPFDGLHTQCSTSVEEILMDCGQGECAAYGWANKSTSLGIWIMQHVGWVPTPSKDVEIIK